MKKRIIAVLLAAGLLASCTPTVPIAESTGEEATVVTTVPTEASVPATTETLPQEEMTPTAPTTVPTEPRLAITDVQQNALNMLNYLAFTAEEIYIAKDNRLILEDIYTALLNEINPGTIDEITQDHLRNLRDIISSFLNIDTKRSRLQYIYNQEKAGIMRSAVPDPLAVLSVVNSVDWKKLATSVVFTVVDSYNNYKSASATLDQEFLLSGWELDDEETETIRRNRDRAFDYMVDIVQEYASDEVAAKELGHLTLNEKAIEKYAEICAADEVYRKIELLTTAETTYQRFGNYWLELADCYYAIGEYESCLDCVAMYNELATGVFLKDFNLVPILPKAIVAAQEVHTGDAYIAAIAPLADAIVANTSDDDWSMRYFAAQVYMDLYAKTEDEAYLKKADEQALNNVTQLIDEQTSLNSIYENDVQEMTVAEPDYSFASAEEADQLKKEYKAEKKRVAAYNKELKETRKTELPPLYEPLVLNCDLLFALAKQMEIDEAEQNKIRHILKTESNGVFLSIPINDRYAFASVPVTNTIELESRKITIPANLLTQGAKITVMVTDQSGSRCFDDWGVEKVERKGERIDTFVAVYTSSAIKDFTWSLGAEVSIQIISGDGYDPATFEFKVTEFENRALIPDLVVFEAV